jgi:hypothetical protein
MVLVHHGPAATIGWLVKKLQHPVTHRQVQAFPIDPQQPAKGNTVVGGPRGQVMKVVVFEPQQSLLGPGAGGERPVRCLA